MQEEYFIRSNNRYKTEAQGNIYEGYIVKEFQYDFMRMKLFQGSMSIMLPIVFQDMDENIKRLKYPCEQRPQIIKTSDDGKINFTFSYVDVKVTINMLSQIRGQLKHVVKSMQPSTMFFDEGDERKPGTNISWFDYKSFTVEEPLYNLAVIACINEKYLYGLFNCPFLEMNLWKPAMIQVAQSIIDESVCEEDKK